MQQPSCRDLRFYFGNKRRRDVWKRGHGEENNHYYAGFVLDNENSRSTGYERIWI